MHAFILKCLKPALALVLTAGLFSTANTMSAPAPQVDVFKINTYITHLYALDPAQSSFKAVVWLSANYPKKTQRLLNRIEFIDADKQHMTLAYSTHNPDGSITEFAKYYVTLAHHFNLTNYPFDKQVLNIRIEDTKSNAQHIKLRLSNQTTMPHSIMEKGAIPEGWKVQSIKPIISTHSYNTNFGKASSNNITNYSQLNIQLHIKRHNSRLFFALFSILYLSYLLSLLTLLIPPVKSYFNATSGLLAASVFSLVGNFLISNTILTHTLSFTLLDKIQLSTLVFVLLHYLVVIYNSHLAKDDRIGTANKIRNITIIMSLIIYCALNIAVFLL
jgi:hypothetical protein